jgi:hypothetical protein
MRTNQSGDEQFLLQGSERWEDLTNIVRGVGNSLLDMVNNVHALISHPGFEAHLGESKGIFEKHKNQFFSDINAFTLKVESLRSRHADKTGTMKTMEELNNYTHLSMLYLNLSTELESLLAPTITAMFLIAQSTEAAKAFEEHAAQEVQDAAPQVETPADPSVLVN